MAFLHPCSCGCVKSELDLFAIPTTQTSVENGQWIHYNTLNSISDEGLLEFVINTADEYIDLSHTLFALNAKLVKEDGANFIATDKIVPVNNILHSLFSRVDVYLNQKLISPPNNTYVYKSYIETLLNYCPAAKNSHLTCGLWYPDTAGSRDSVEDANAGCKNRLVFIKENKEFDLIGHLNCDLFKQNKFLINGVELRIKLVRSRNQGGGRRAVSGRAAGERQRGGGRAAADERRGQRRGWWENGADILMIPFFLLIHFF
ncbi:uncharacterized protein F54H12.2-like [Zophobas morio]|uniref:uncharacterized protein F54H12.2-like n=1 Tax=Zophobas morio TaxID=2755281 RepID=UPI003082C5A5